MKLMIVIMYNYMEMINYFIVVVKSYLCEL